MGRRDSSAWYSMLMCVASAYHALSSSRSANVGLAVGMSAPASGEAALAAPSGRYLSVRKPSRPSPKTPRGL